MPVRVEETLKVKIRVYTTVKMYNFHCTGEAVSTTLENSNDPYLFKTSDFDSEVNVFTVIDCAPWISKVLAYKVLFLSSNAQL